MVATRAWWMAGRRNSISFLLGLGLAAAGCDGQLPFAEMLWPTLRPTTAPTASVEKGLGVPAFPAEAAALRQQLVRAVNAERKKQNHAALESLAALDRMADYHATRMIEGGFFAHTDPFDGSTVGIRAAKFDYLFAKVGENLAAGQPTASAVVADWMGSSGHRSNILDPEFTQIGVAVLDGGPWGRVWVVEFGRPENP